MLTVIIEEDPDHITAVQGDLYRSEAGSDEEAACIEVIRNLDDGTWTAYSVAVCEVCPGCDRERDEVLASLWGCVVDTDNAAGRYDDPDKIKDQYLREVAFGLLYEARERESESDG